MNSYELTIFHNQDSRFGHHAPHHELKLAVSHFVDFPAGTTAQQAAAWAFETFNMDLDMLEPGRGRPGGELTFLAACVYRLLHQRSLSVGDVVHIQNGSESTWLACQNAGWTPIAPPASATRTGTPLDADKVYGHLTETFKAISAAER